MQTFDQALFELYEKKIISFEEVMRNADSKNELRLRIKLESKRDVEVESEGTDKLKLMDDGGGRAMGN